MSDAQKTVIRLGYLTAEEIATARDALADTKFEVECAGEWRWHDESGEPTDICWMESSYPVDTLDVTMAIRRLREAGVKVPVVRVIVEEAE